MRKLISLLLLLVAAPVVGDNLSASSFTYMGFFRLPNGGDFNWGARDLTYMSDCMGETDPTPSDGYPGCILSVDEDFNVAITDIAEPTLTGANVSTNVLSEWDITGTLPTTEGYGGGGSNELMGIYYEEGPPCRIWWLYGNEYANQPFDDDPVLGYSACDEVTPNPQGMWRWDDTSDLITTDSDPWRATSWVYNITRVPSGIATDYFGGDEMAFGPGKSTGSRGSSLGPSFAVRDWNIPSGDDMDGVTLVNYYQSSIGYPRWYIPTAFRGATDTQAGNVARTMGLEFVRINSGGTDYEAAIFLGTRGEIDNTVYPGDTPTAKPTESPWDVGSDTYLTNDEGWPTVATTPIQWYGTEEFQAGQGDTQQPSFNDFKDDGNRMPWDENLVRTCTGGTGPSANKINAYLYLYSLPDMGDIYDGTEPDNESQQPYAEINVTVDPDNDGWQYIDSCSQPTVWNGMTIDSSDSSYSLLYFSHNPDPTGDAPPYGNSKRRGISVYRIEPPSGHTPDPEGNKTGAEGGGVAGGGVG